MIYQGCNGSLNLFYKDKLISSFALTRKKTFENYKYQGEYLILESLKENLNIKKQIYTYTYFCNSIYSRKIKNLPIRRSDHEMFLSCFFALLKLKIIDSEDYLIMPRKKLPKLKTTILKN